MTRVEGTPEIVPPSGRLEAREKTIKQTRDEIGGLKRQIENQQDEQRRNKFIDQSVRQAQERMAKGGGIQRIETAQGTINDLPEDTRSQWTTILNRLHAHATVSRNGGNSAADGSGSIGDPIAVVNLLSSTESELQGLRKIVAVMRDPQGNPDTSALTALHNIEDAYERLHNTIGGNFRRNTMVQQFLKNRNNDVIGRGNEIARQAVFLVAAAGALITGIIALRSKEGEESYMATGIYLAVAALAAGLPSLTRSGTQRLGGQIEFLTKIDGDWEHLQNIYGLRGTDWAAFTESFYARGTTNTKINDFINGRNPTELEQQRDAFKAIAPVGIHAKINQMFESRNAQGVPAADFRTMIGCLLNATTPRSQAIVVNFVRAGSNRSNIQNLIRPNGPVSGPEQAPGEQENKEKVNQEIAKADALRKTNTEVTVKVEQEQKTKTDAPPAPDRPMDVASRTARVLEELRTRFWNTLPEDTDLLTATLPEMTIDGIRVVIGGGQIVVGNLPIRIQGSRSGVTREVRPTSLIRNGNEMTMAFPPITVPVLGRQDVDPAQITQQRLAEIIVQLSTPGGTANFRVTRPVPGRAARVTDVRVFNA